MTQSLQCHDYYTILISYTDPQFFVYKKQVCNCHCEPAGEVKDVREKATTWDGRLHDPSVHVCNHGEKSH